MYSVFTDLDLNLVPQLDALEYKAHWQNHDASLLDIASRVDLFTLGRHVAAMKFLTKIVEFADKEERQTEVISALYGLSESRWDDEAKPSKFLGRLLLGSLDDTILHYRNDIALDALDRERSLNPEGDLVLIWGAAHLKGLARGLEGRGFKKESDEKIVAIDPHSSLLK